MSKVAIVTDSTAYIPDPLLEQYHISVAPLVLIWGQETYEDGISMLPTEFYNRLKTAKTMPTSSQVTPSSFYKIFSDLIKQNYQVLAILISDQLSGTLSSANQATEMLPGAPIEIINSHSTAMALGFQVLATARAAADGANMEECKAVAVKACQNSGIVFAVDTLEFLHRGGRIGGASRFLGTTLNIKPVLEVSDGRIDAVERVRTRSKSLDRLLEVVKTRINGDRPIRLATVHANAPAEAEALLKKAAEHLGAKESILAEVSPVVGTHTGPGTVGLAYMTGI